MLLDIFNVPNPTSSVISDSLVNFNLTFIHLTYPSWEHVKNSCLSLGCQLPLTSPAMWPFVLAMSVIYWSPLTHSAFSYPSRSTTLAYKNITSLHFLVDQMNYSLGYLCCSRNDENRISSDWIVEIQDRMAVRKHSTIRYIQTVGLLEIYLSQGLIVLKLCKEELIPAKSQSFTS